MAAIWRWDVGDYESLTIATKRVSQEEGELAVSIVDVPRLAFRYVNEGVDNISQSWQALVDHSGLLESLTNGISLLGPFTTSQVYDVEPGGLDVPDTALSHWLGLYDRSEDWVGPRALFVHCMRPHMSVFGSDLNEFDHIFSWKDNLFL